MSSPPSDSEPQAYELLSEGVRRWIWEQGWEALRDVQESSIRTLFETDRDLLIAASTAAGKTEAAFLPVISKLCTDPPESLGALYVGPLKALINDQFRRLEDLCAELEVPVHRWHGDVGQSAKKQMLENPRGVLLITPESLEALFVTRGTRVGALFGELGYVVIDEMHSFLGSERGTQLQSLLHRVERCSSRAVVRIGLSATLGDMDLAARFLREADPERVERLESKASGGELRLALRAYECGEGGDEGRIAQHLFDNLRGENNLIFANSRAEVETQAAALRALCEDARLPVEFHPHHGSLSRELRESLEASLKQGGRPVSAVCTTTMEMGIDLGSVASVAQIGAPNSVASLRQRLGRSGRRGGPAVLRVYVREPRLEPDLSLEWTLRSELVQSMAVIELLLERWCEPSIEGGLFLSTLIQQTLSVIAERSGATAAELGETLLDDATFGELDTATYVQLLRDLGQADLITQMGDGTLVLGLTGERLVGSYEFFAAFESSQEIELRHGSTPLGRMPVNAPLVPGNLLVFAGRRWRIEAIRAHEGVCLVEPAAGGEPPTFLGRGPDVHDEVRRKMREIWTSDAEPAYLDDDALRLLREGRSVFESLGLDHNSVLPAEKDTLVFPWIGDRALHTLALWLRRADLRVDAGGLYLRIDRMEPGEFRDHAAELADEGPPDAVALALDLPNGRVGKHAHYLSPELAARDYAKQKLDAPEAHRALVSLLSD